MVKSDIKILVCIPAYNEARSIVAIIEKARSYATEIIVCDDGSIDDTSELARKAGATVIRHHKNIGYGGAIKTLFSAAKKRDPDVMVTIDSDGQHNPDQIPDIIEPILNNQADIVIGSRFLMRSDFEKVPLYRMIGIKAITKLSQIVSYNNITDAQSGFRAYGRKVLSAIELTEEGMAVSAEILVKAKDNNFRIKEVPVTIIYDVEDTSTHNPVSHGIGVVLAIIRFISIKHPLLFYGIPGIALLAIAAFFTLNTIQLFYSENQISTNMLVIAIGSGMAGLILTITAVILYILAIKTKPHLIPEG
jgi:glycosyltransferase involved in cell wall biosynthesis